ncbi:MAG TPA: choice-of-anchor P family protein [Verrucomicrobiae bacterium]|nr:choice-of-anchor P family protein [Verrucomicrobiae bacterium]
MQRKIFQTGKLVMLAAAVATPMLLVPAAQAHEVHASGRAIGVDAVVKFGTLTKTLQLANTPMSCTGSAREEIISTVSNPLPLGLSAKTVRGYAIGRDDVAATAAGIEELHINLSNGLRVDATALQSNAEARCNEATFAVTTTGSSDVATLSINGQSRTITGQPNQVIEVPGVARVVVNEQIRPSSREIIVNALHIKLFDAETPVNGDIVLANSRSKITCAR